MGRRALSVGSPRKEGGGRYGAGTSVVFHGSKDLSSKEEVLRGGFPVMT